MENTYSDGVPFGGHIPPDINSPKTRNRKEIFSPQNSFYPSCLTGKCAEFSGEIVFQIHANGGKYRQKTLCLSDSRPNENDCRQKTAFCSHPKLMLIVNTTFYCVLKNDLKF